MGEAFVIGGLSLNKVWLVYALGFALAYFIFRKRDQKNVSILVNILIIIVLFWRFGAFLFDPITFIKNPALFIQVYGTNREVITGIIASVFYLMYRNHRSPINITKLLDLAALCLIMVLLVKNMFVAEYGLETSFPWGISIQDPAYTYHPINGYHVIWMGLILVAFWRLPFFIGEGKYFIYTAFFGGLGYMVISLFNTEQDATLLLSKGQWMYLLCMMVGWVYAFKRPKIEWGDTMSHGHRFNPEKASKLLDPKRKEKLPPNVILSLFDLIKGDIVADFGAGNGFFTIPIAEKTESAVYAIDIEPKMLAGLEEHATQKGIENIKPVTADLANTTLEPESLDKIFSSFVMHEVPDLQAVMEEMKRILKPGGKILVVDWEAVEMNEGPPLHVRIPSNQLKAAFEKEGFYVEKQMINSGVYALIMMIKGRD